MAIEFFNTESTATNPQLFFNEWIKEQKGKVEGKAYEVKEIKRAKSGKGYMLATDHFNCWIWSNSTLAKHLLEALEVWVNKGIGYKLIVEIHKNSKDGYLIGVDKDVNYTWFQASGKYSTSEGVLSTDGESGNPYL